MAPVSLPSALEGAVAADWLRETLAHCQGDSRCVMEQLALAHAHECCVPCIPENMLSVDCLPGRRLLQVVDGADIGRKHDEQDRPPGKRTLKLCLTDGARYAFAVERKPMSDALSGTHGVKIICQDVPVRMGHLLLTPRNTFVVGGGCDFKVTARGPVAHDQQSQLSRANSSS
ncbi:RecQ-mediated genome instability protein 1 [Plasmodiophora brassicae]|uniref:RecQ-mediated genome instability protein 1 n=1 Tax=Plasmodiophora brassicae TaxID=37360 RepID=A0A0G4J8X8_PLABS|nr:hypothetical protein PBRA_003348 [Plasmodiophora brassicae]SPQ99700.1 unnamed protein product [Plasmodiophora brassicae]